jgi:(S)-ureidoglycine aminohydrolase
MNLFGCTRSHVAKDHALLAPESFVRSTLPSWDNTEVIILVSPALRARFTQYLALMNAGAVAGQVQAGCERVVFVLEGEVLVRAGRAASKVLAAGGFAYFPPGAGAAVQARTACRLNVFEKPYVPLAGVPAPSFLCGREQDVEGLPFMGDSDARLKTLLPADPAFDLAVNVFTFRPGAALPLVEVHVMEHGLLMLEGQGVYRLGDGWYPVREGDAIWMAPYCTQWFVAMGKGPARYLYYKDVNREPPLSGSC